MNLALAKEVPDKDGKLVANPYKMWNEIDPSLPAVKIEVLGPPPTSGTRDSFAELVMEAGALKFESLAELKKSDAKAWQGAQSASYTASGWKAGDKVLLNGYGVGETHWGGLAQKARVKGDWLVALPWSERSDDAIDVDFDRPTRCVEQERHPRRFGGHEPAGYGRDLRRPSPGDPARRDP